MTPKEQFLETPHAAELKKMVGNPSFREILNFATLECQRIILEGDPADQFTATKQANRIAGALVFRATLETLAMEEKLEHPTQPPTLHHDAYDPRKRNG